MYKINNKNIIKNSKNKYITTYTCIQNYFIYNRFVLDKDKPSFFVCSM